MPKIVDYCDWNVIFWPNILSQSSLESPIMANVCLAELVIDELTSRALRNLESSRETQLCGYKVLLVADKVIGGT